MYMDGLTVILAAIMTAWLWRKHAAKERESTAPPAAAFSPVYRVALGFVVGVFLLTAILLIYFVL